MLWYPVGYTAGYLVLLVLVAAPLRRSGAYTLPDFAEARLDSRAVRRRPASFVVVIGWLYLVPQFQGAGAGAPRSSPARRLGGAACSSSPSSCVNVVAGGMRSITFVQAFQYWLKLTALPVPVMFSCSRWRRRDSGRRADAVGDTRTGPRPRHPLYQTYSLIVALCSGTMGLPHVLVRFYTNPDGRAARRTTLIVLALLGVFYLFPPVYGLLGRIYAPDLAQSGQPTRVVLVLPGGLVGGRPATCCPRWSRPARSPRSCPRRRG